MTKRKEFLQSSEFQNFLLSIKFHKDSLQNVVPIAISNIVRSYLQDNTNSKRIAADLFSFALLDEGENDFLQQKLNIGFDDSFPKAIIVASEVLYRKDMAGYAVSNETKLFEETFFTDSDTAALLENHRSYVGNKFPKSFLKKTTKTHSHVSLGEAIRASISDPNLVTPASIDNMLFTTGAVNINPLDIATKLANEVFAKYPGEWDEIIEVPTLSAVYGFDPRVTRKEFSTSRDVDYWIDGETKNFKGLLGPKINFNLKNIGSDEEVLSFLTSVPIDNEMFSIRILNQYKDGANITFDSIFRFNLLKKEKKGKVETL